MSEKEEWTQGCKIKWKLKWVKIEKKGRDRL